MGVTKTKGHSTKNIETATLLKALAHPARIAIVSYLLKHKACICNDLVNELPLAQATISQHLKELKLARIIKGEIEGPSMCYCLDMDTLKKLSRHLHPIIHYTSNTNCC
jgi:DNA-binding transcriptional ArsR family regulator